MGQNLSCHKQNMNEYKQSFITNENKITHLSIFNIKNIYTFGKVVKCYDADTVWIIFRDKYSEEYIKLRCRMAAYNSPELKGDDCENGAKAKTAFTNLVLNQFVYCKIDGFDKYGRLLIWIYLINENHINEKSVNEWMIENGYGIVYKELFDYGDIELSDNEELKSGVDGTSS